METTPMVDITHLLEASRELGVVDVDVRPSPPFARGDIPGAVNVPGFLLSGIGTRINGSRAPAAEVPEMDEATCDIGEPDASESVGADDVLASLDDPATVILDTPVASE